MMLAQTFLAPKAPHMTQQVFCILITKDSSLLVYSQRQHQCCSWIQEVTQQGNESQGIFTLQILLFTLTPE